MTRPISNIRRPSIGVGSDPCRMGCKTFRPVSASIVDPSTVSTVAECVACGKPQARLCNLIGYLDPDNGLDAASFVASFIAAKSLGGGKA